MRINAQQLRQGNTLLQTIDDDPFITVIYGEGGGCTLDVFGEASGIWVPLRGAMQVQNAALNHSLHAREILITERESHVKAIGHGDGRWLALLGGKQVWESLLADTPASNAGLLPEKYLTECGFRRRAIALARSAFSAGPTSALYAIADDIARMQSPLHEAIARCPGRTYANRRQAFLRLQHVRQFICTRCDRDLDNEMLARVANYSPTHFIRIFNEVFLETPHAYLVKQRLLMAERLLRSGNLAVREVALASGFENRSAFSRSFHEHFGITANDARQHFHAVTDGSLRDAIA